MAAIDPVYTVASTATGGGRDGQVVSQPGRVDLDMRPPTEMGGSGESSHCTSVLSLTPPSASRLPWMWKAALPPPKTSKVPGPKKWRLCDAPVHHH